MLSARESIGILLGRRSRFLPVEQEFDYLSGVEDLWRTRPHLIREPQKILGEQFGTVVQTVGRVRTFSKRPALYFCLHCTHCNRPLGEGCNYRQLLGFRQHPDRGCLRQDCKSPPPKKGDWLKTLCLKHTSFQNYARVGITLSLYKLLLPELVPSTYGGCYGFPEKVADIPTDPKTAFKFCHEMRDGKPYSRARNAMTPFLVFREILEPNEARWSPRFSDALEEKLLDPETNFFLSEKYPQITYLEMEDMQEGSFIQFFTHVAELENYYDIEEESEVMVAIRKVDNSVAQAMVTDRANHGAKARMFIEVLHETAKLSVGEHILVDNKDDDGKVFDVSNFHNFVKRHGMAVGTHLSIRKQIFDEAGNKIKTSDRGFVICKLAEFSFDVSGAVQDL